MGNVPNAHKSPGLPESIDHLYQVVIYDIVYIDISSF